MNKVFGGGRLVADPETSPVGEGSVTKFRVAVDGKVVMTKDGVKKDENGYTVKKVWWANCKAWNGKGKLVQDYYKKGDYILFEGILETETWEDKNEGGMRSKDVVEVLEIIFTPKGSGGSSDAKPATEKKKAGRPRKQDAPVVKQENLVDNSNDASNEEEIPF